MYLSLQFPCALTFCMALCAIPRLAAQTIASPAPPGFGPDEQPSRNALPSYTPMTPTQAFSTYLAHVFSLESILRSAAVAGIDQATNTPHEWGEGSDGYGRRFASAYGQHFVQSTWMYGAGTLFHEDNRYFLSGESSLKARLKYAILSAFLARHDDGSRHLSISALSSYAGAAFLSRAWQPPSTRGPGRAMGSLGATIGAEAGIKVAREFLSSILHSHAPVTGR